ncbi:MAG TPA: arginine--tRNA ligase [Bauldia sp.]|nr:arginine--tRNA ligase [Bauldia sp.]
MNIFQDFTNRIKTIVQTLPGAEQLSTADIARIIVEPPRDPSHGDLACNAAMVLAKPLATKPRELATRIGMGLARDRDVETAEIAGPGFVNIRLQPAYLQRALASLIADGEAYGRSRAGEGIKINVEYVSANPTGPMHVGHCRGAAFGDALANLLAFAGHEVTREYYINDAGAQVDVLARSAFLRYREALGEEIGPIPEGFYPGDYLKPVGEALAREHGSQLLAMPESEWLPIVRGTAVGMMMEMIRDDLKALAIEHEVFFSERSLTAGEPNAVAAMIAALRAKGYVYQGRLPPPKGQVPEDWEDREQTLFRATAFGDDVDRPLVKSDGSYTYFASDIAYHYEKFRRGFHSMIDVLGADHGGYVRRMQAAVKAISEGTAELDVKIVQLVRLFRAGEPVKMSKRAGEFVTLREVVDEVGPDPIRFMMVFRKNDAPLDFDFQKVTEQSRDNPVFYVQYAHARTCSIFRQAESEMPDADTSVTALRRAPLDRLADAGEMALIRRLVEYPRVIEAAAAAHEPHRVAFYLHDLASEFHAHWNRGKELPQLRFINPADSESTLARLALVHATKLVLSSGLAILGVSAPEEMR